MLRRGGPGAGVNTLVNIRPRVPLGNAADPIRQQVNVRPRPAPTRPEATASSAPHAPDYTLVMITLALLCIGVVMVYSASLMAAYKTYNDQAYFFQRQLIWCALGLVVMLLLMRVPYQMWRRFSIVALLGSVALLIAVFIPGLSGNALGATRWIELHNVKIGQPSELIKITLVLYMADWLARKGERVRDFAYGLAPFAIILCLILGLIIKQPDMGTAIVIGATAFAIFFVSGANLRQLLPLTLLGAAGFLVLALESKYRQGRLSSFMNPWKDPTNTGYHVVQSLIALGDGGIRGLGLGASQQKFWLPFPYTDSIFAIIGEELGIIGGVGVLLLFLLLAYRGLRAARLAPDAFGSLLAIGISCQLVIQALLNVAVVTSTLPFTGITLPMVSYGGSSMLVSFASMGVLLNVTKYSRDRKEEAAEATASAHRRGRERWARVPSHRRAGFSAHAGRG